MRLSDRIYVIIFKYEYDYDNCGLADGQLVGASPAADVSEDNGDA